MITVQYSPQALDDIHDQLVYYRFISDDLARRFRLELDATVQFLAQFPYVGKAWETKRRSLRTVRFWTVSSFPKIQVYYKPGRTLYVQRVLHGARDIEREL